MHPTTPALEHPTPTALPCPDCETPLPPSPVGCPACGLPLRGPAAARLWAVDRELEQLGVRTGALRRERASLLQALRGVAVPATGPAPVPPALPAPQARAEWDLRRVQSTLLAAGALLLCVAAAVFAAVTYDELGLVGQSLVLLALTAGAGAAVPRLVRRGLGATAEALAAVTLALVVLDAYAARRAGLAGLDAVDGAAYWAVASGAIALLAGVAALRLPGLRVPVLAAVAAAQLPVLITASELPVPAAAWLLPGQAGLDLLALLALRRRADHPRLPAATTRLADHALQVAGLAVGALAALRAVGGLLEAAYLDGPAAPHALTLLALAALAVAAVPQAPTRRGREVLAALPVLLPAAAVAGLVLASPAAAAQGVSALALPLAALGTLAVAAATATAHLARVDSEAGALAAGVAVLAAGVAPVVPDAATAVAGPLAWPAQAWSLATSSARAAVSPVQSWAGDPTHLAVLALTATGVLLAAAGASRRSPRAAGLLAVTGAALAGAAALTLPLALDASYAVALAAHVALGAALLALGVGGHRLAGGVLPRTAPDVALLAGAATLTVAAAWSTAAETASLAVLPLAALLVGTAAALLPAGRGRGALVLLAGLAAGAAGTATAVSAGAPAERAGFLLLAVPAALLALAASGRTGRDRTLGAEAAAALLTVAALALASADTGWSAWTLAAAGLLGLATALRPDRRRLAPVGGLLLAASSWVRLDAAGVDAPEPYVVPVALVALALGHSRRRRDPATTSRAAYGPGLAGLLLPSLLATLGDPTLPRTLLLGAVALAVALLGARARLAAPLVAGSAVLTVLALQQLAPLADALPRWTALAVAGAVLLAVGATYEQRRRDVARLRRAYRALA